MARVKTGDLQQLDQIFHRYQQRIFGYFLKSTGSAADSDDLTQDLFMRVLKYRKSYKEGEPVQIWIFRIARNLLMDFFSRSASQNSRETSMVKDLPEAESNWQETEEKENKLHGALQMLSPEKRELLVLSKFNGMPYQQIAELNNTTVANVKVQVHRTLKELKELYFRLDKTLRL